MNPPPRWPIIDRETVERLRALQMPDERDSAHRVVRLFLDGTPELVDAIRAGLHMRDIGAIHRAAHTLAAAAAEVGAIQLREVAGQLERRCEDPRPTFTDLAEEFDRIYARTAQALAEMNAP